jgi:hypothetical protein
MSISTQISRINASRDTIRAKLQTLGIATGTDKLDALATAISNIIDRGAVSVEIKEGTTYTIPAGYHNGSGVVSAISDAEGDAEAYKKQSKTVTPTKSQLNVTPDEGFYALGSVTVEPIPDAFQNVSSVTADAGSVLTGKIFVASDGEVVAGTMANNGAVKQTLNGTTITYKIPAGYHNGSGTVSITLEEKTVTPSVTAQTITPSSTKVLSKVIVNAIPEKFADTSNATVDASEILYGQIAYGIENGKAKEITGTMPNNEAISGTITGMDEESSAYAVPAGYTTGGTVTLSKDIENALAAI